MMGKQKRAYSEVMRAAGALVECLQPACERIAIAGSLRRKKPEVGDIEIVAIPSPVLNLFGEASGETYVDYCLADWGIHLSKNGPKYKQWQSGDACQIDLFLATPDNWGLILMIRTGSADFSKRMMTQRAWGGYLPDGLKVSDGQVWQMGAHVSVPEEADLFALWKMDYIEPGERF